MQKDPYADLRRREDMNFDGHDFDRDPRALDSKGNPHVTAVSLTQQGMMDECDISFIMKQILKGAYLPGTRTLNFGDVSAAPDFHQAVTLVAQANQRFAELPASTRDFFHNDPARLMAFVADEKNYDKASELGLIDAKKAAVRMESINNGVRTGDAPSPSPTAKKPTPPAAPKEGDKPD